MPGDLGDMLISTAEASAIYKVPQRTIRQWAQDGRLTVTRRGRRALYRIGEIDQLVELLRKND